MANKERSKIRTELIRESIKKTLESGITENAVAVEGREVTLLVWHVSSTGGRRFLSARLIQHHKNIAKISDTVVRVRKDTSFKDIFREYASRKGLAFVEIDEVYVSNGNEFADGSNVGYMIQSGA